MKFLSTKVHACIDYLCAIVMISSSMLFNLNAMENYILLTSGIVTLLYSCLTHYEFSVLDLIRLNKHLKMDILSGTGLIIAPWVFSFSMEAYVLFFILGSVKILIGCTTSSRHVLTKHYGGFHKMYDMPVHFKMEKFPRMKI